MTDHRHPADQRRHDRLKAEHDYRVNQLALTYLIAWHRDAHGQDCRCAEQVGAYAEQTLTALEHDFTARSNPAPPVAAGSAPEPVHTA